MKRRICLAAVVMGLLVALCAGSQNVQIQEVKEEPKELVLWSYYETKAQQEGLDLLVEGFNASQKEYVVFWEYIPISDFIKELSMAVSESALPDMILVDNPDMQSLVKTGMLADLTEQLEGRICKEDYYDAVWSTVEYEERIYGVPFCCNNTAIIYNEKMLEEAGIEPPETWEEFELAAERLTTEEHYGFVMSAASGEQGAFQFLPWLLYTGADKQNLTDERTKEAFLLMERLLQNGSMPSDCMNWSQTDVTRTFVTGKAAMIENGPWALPEIEKTGIRYGICTFPAHNGGSVVVGGEDLAVLEGKNADGAVSFIDYYNQENTMKEICETTGNISPIRSAAKEQCQEHSRYEVFVEQMEYSISRNSIPGWKKICRMLSDSLYKIFGEQESADKIWKTYADEISNEIN